MSKLARFLAALLLAATALLCFAYWSRTRVQLETVTLPCADRGVAAGLTILQLSDLHLAEFGAYEQRVQSLAQSAHADVIVITGDFFKMKGLWKRPASQAFLRALNAVEQFVGGLEAPLGVYACRGNNDHSRSKESSDLLLHVLQRNGVRVLCNEQVKLPIAGDVRLLGIDFPCFEPGETAEFVVAQSEHGRVLQSGASKKDSYSNFLLGDVRPQWKNYGYSGRFCRTQPRHGGIGFLFYSQLDRGQDGFYRFRVRANDNVFRFSNHGAYESFSGVRIQQRVSPPEWFNFRVEVANNPAGRRLRGRIWPLGQTEPTAWQMDEEDVTASFAGGTVGLWSAGAGRHLYDDLVVYTFAGDTLMHETFENLPVGAHPLGWVDFDHEQQAIPWLTRQIPDSAVTLLLAHTPDAVLAAAPADVDVQLSGHSHGGQIRLPLVGALLVHQSIGRKYAQGLFQWENTRLYVNRGIGTTRLPLRLFCPPEITLLRLTRK